MARARGLLGGRAEPRVEDRAFDVSIVIPVLKADQSLATSLQRIAAWARKIQWTVEVVIADDACGQSVEKIARKWQSFFDGFQIARHEKRRGAGLAARTGLFSARGQYVVVIDPSVSTPIENVTPLVQSLAMGADVAVTARPRRGESDAETRPFLERAAETTFVAMTKLVCPVGVRDTLCGLIAFRCRAATKIAQRSQVTGAAFTIEWLAVAEWLGFQTTECPQRWVSRHVQTPAMLRASQAPAVLRDLYRTRKRMSVDAMGGPATPRELLSETSFTKLDPVKFAAGLSTRQR